ncbi:MAG: hypothetical protein IPH16_16105 [Haliscomenobacter sp.]|nr:hypothetical protein [Haliscomenobacter sp.]
MAILTRDVPFKPDLAYFPEVKLQLQQSGPDSGYSVIDNGSKAIFQQPRGRSLCRVPRGKNVYQAGEVYPVYIYR